MEGQKGSKKRKQVDLSSFYQVVDDRTKKKDKELQKQRDTLIEELFGDGPEIGVDDGAIEEVQDVHEEGSSQATAKAKKPRKWRPAWKYQHPWAYPIIFEGKVRVKCEWCAYYKHKNPYANKGSTVLQLPSLNDHSVSNEHKHAAMKWANNEKRVCIPLPDYVAIFDDKEKVRVSSPSCGNLTLL